MTDLASFLPGVHAVMEDVDQLVVPSDQRVGDLEALMKAVFDHSCGTASRAFGPFDELTTEGLDAESIWEELRSRNGPLTKFLKKKSSTLLKALDRLDDEGRAEAAATAGQSESEEEDEEGDYDEEEEGEEEEDAEDSAEEEGSDAEEEGMSAEASSDEGAGESDDEDMAAAMYGSDDGDNESGGSLDEAEAAFNDEDYDSDGMEQWLDKQEELEDSHRRKLERLEAKLAQRGAVEEGDSDASEDDQLWVQSAMYEDGDDEDDGATAKFSDYFVPDNKEAPKSKIGKGKKGNAAATATKGKGKGKDKKQQQQEQEQEGEDSDADSFEYPSEGDEEDGEEQASGSESSSSSGSSSDSDSDSAEEAPKKALTSYERKRANKAAEIADIESGLMGKKSWELVGEVNSGDRPENSLLEVSADIERASKPAPIVTQEHTNTLEELILKRITDFNFDDVQPPEEAGPAAGGSDAPDLSQEKSRLGLGEVYAQEFLASTGQAADPEAETDAHRDVKSLFHKVCRQLDALSHFHYTPRPEVQEAAVSVNVASLAIEEVTPAAGVAGSSTFAPEDVHAKKRGRAGALQADEELSRHDRKRLRNAGKAVRRKGRQEADFKDRARAVTGDASASYEARQTDESMRDRRVSTGTNEEGISYSRSNQFFEKLQAQAQSDIAQGVAGKKLRRPAKASAAAGLTSSRVKM